MIARPIGATWRSPTATRVIGVACWWTMLALPVGMARVRLTVVNFIGVAWQHS